MRRKRGNTNIKILQSQLKNFALEEAKDKETKGSVTNVDMKGGFINKVSTEVTPINDKVPKKKGIKKDELINTKRLLTM